MSSTPSEATGATAEDALKRRLLNRIAIAAVMVVGLLGSLAIFDVIVAPGRHPAKMAAVPADTPVSETPATETQPAGQAADATSALSAAMTAALPTQLSTVAAAPPWGVSAPATTQLAAAPAVAPATPAQAPSTAKATSAKVEPRAVAEGTSATGAPPLPPLPPEKGFTKPATTRPVAIRPSEPVAPANSLAARPDPGRTIARAPRVAGVPGVPPRAPASRPLSRISEQFALQMGVFTNVANAEDLRAKLELHGIPSTIEARVHVGPFASREEADAAREKLKELGLDGGLLVTLKK